jgi:hypothetical protein
MRLYGLDWSGSEQGRHWEPLEYTIMNLPVPWNVIKSLSSWRTGDSQERHISAVTTRHCGGRLIAVSFVLVFSLTYTSTLQMEVKCSSETSFDFTRAIRSYIPQDTAVRTSNPTSVDLTSRFSLDWWCKHLQHICNLTQNLPVLSVCRTIARNQMDKGSVCIVSIMATRVLELTSFLITTCLCKTFIYTPGLCLHAG